MSSSFILLGFWLAYVRAYNAHHHDLILSRDIELLISINYPTYLFRILSNTSFLQSILTCVAYIWYFFVKVKFRNLFSLVLVFLWTIRYKMVKFEKNIVFISKLKTILKTWKLCPTWIRNRVIFNFCEWFILKIIKIWSNMHLISFFHPLDT